MKMSEIREMTDPELKNSIDELSKEKFNLKIQAKTGQLQNGARIKQVKNDIARIKTEQTRRNSAGDQ
ncbi:MAG TPA: 50S ribosomal protein L29 [Victivallales bacterium]|nr:50S ribosomal protein L29 [Victivallales bacterium]